MPGSAEDKGMLKLGFGSLPLLTTDLLSSPQTLLA
jgi:hypothetical protein